MPKFHSEKEVTVSEKEREESRLVSEGKERILLSVLLKHTLLGKSRDCKLITDECVGISDMGIHKGTV